jgi:uncharacterized protein YjbI with pentapeptide repeats
MQDNNNRLPIEEYLSMRKRFGVPKNYQFQDLRNRTFVGADFSSMDLSHSDLSGCYFKQCKFKDTNFSQANLKGTTFYQCDIEGCKMIDAMRSQSTKFLNCSGKAVFFKKQQTDKTKNWGKALQRTIKKNAKDIEELNNKAQFKGVLRK